MSQVTITKELSVRLSVAYEASKRADVESRDVSGLPDLVSLARVIGLLHC